MLRRNRALHLPQHAGSGMTAGASGLAFEVILDVTIPRQTLNNWCWAAVGVGIAEAYGDPTESQCDVATRVINIPRPVVQSCCWNGVPDYVCNRPKRLPLALRVHFGGQYDRFSSVHHMEFEFIQRRIDEGTPICVRLELDNMAAGHFVVIFGYRKFKGRVDLHVADPSTGQKSLERLEEFRVNFRQYGGWDLTMLTKGARRVPRL